MNHFTFNGHSTAEYGLLVTGLSTYGSPARRVEKISVPGRNGDVLLDEGTFDNYIARYQIAIIDNFKVNARAIANWLLSSRGYSELTDTYNPETYRMASFYSNIDYVVTALSREGTATIEFDCKPQRYFYDNAPITFTANAYTGTLDTGNIPNTAEAPLSLSLKGNTAQDGTPTPDSPVAIQSVSGDNTVTVCGKNLLPIATSQTVNGITYSVNNDGSIKVSGTATASANLDIGRNALVLPQGTYFSNVSGNNVSIIIYKVVNGTASVIKNGGGLFTLTESTSIFMRLSVANGTTVNTVIYPQIEHGSTATDYEPYIAQEYPITLPVENYFDINTVFADTSKFTISGDSVVGLQTRFASSAARFNIPSELVGKQLTFQAYITASEGTRDYFVYTQANVGGTNISGTRIYSGTNGLSYLTFTPTSTNDYVWIPSSVDAGATLTISNIMLSIGGLNTYQPYGTTPIELNKIGSYADYFHNVDGSWYLHKEIGEVDLGMLTWSYNSTYLMMSAPVDGQVNVGGSKAGLCTYYPSVTYWVSSTDWANNDKIMNNLGGSDTLVRIKDTSYTDATTFKTAMSGVMLYYALATAEEIEVTDTTLISQLNAISQAMSYRVTNILQENNDLPFNLDVTAMTSGTLTAEHNAEPIITVNSVGSIYVNGNYLKVLSAPITINSKTMQAYSGNVLKNNEVEGDFPLFNEGDNEVSSDVDLTIIPNYWEL